MSPTIDEAPSTYVGRPRYEGANIRTWIGFKHFEYLLEEAVLQWFRDRGLGPAALYHAHGVGLEIVDSSIRLPATLTIDDEVRATATPGTPRRGQGLPFTVKLTVERDGQEVTILVGKVRVALVHEKDAPANAPVPAALEPFTVAEVAQLVPSAAGVVVPQAVAVPEGSDVRTVLAPEGSNDFLWSWRIPYFYCHFSDRLQHSGYVRAMEEVVDRFLDARGISVGRMLDERGWIPVVSRARVQLLADAYMEETVHTVFTVEEIIKDVMYTARMACYVLRDGHLVPTATGSILHGYALSRGENAGALAEFDDTARAALLGVGA
ncbi:thioesterase family protein [Streptacidiphilus neutrinimicus]|uniref:thioesterase family protein n=1 Tax=Streptacidiphilus neutrinimicus TaxID=105420 RepID=UPI0005A9F840|nr:thioesterase family protein [Streptacidiphilus neutrinimicus]